MELTAIVDRLRSSAGSISYYDASAHGRLVIRSYPELAADVAAAKARLTELAISPGMRVGIRAPNSYHWIVYDLALLELRCVIVAFPESGYDLDDHALATRFDLALLLVPNAEHERARHAFVAPIDGPFPHSVRARSARTYADPGYEEFSLVFSSGSAGRIRCLVTSRAGTEQTIDRFVELFDLAPRDRARDRFLLFLPLSNFQQRLTVYGVLYYGIDLLMVDPPRLFSALQELRPTVFIGPPLFFETVETKFAQQPRLVRGAIGTLTALAEHAPAPVRARLLRAIYRPLWKALGGAMRVMITGSAPIKRTTLELFGRGGFPLYEVYGVTECGLVACNGPGHNRRGAVGRAFEPGSITLAEDGEILVKNSRPLTLRYEGEDPDEVAGIYLADGTIATGDLGRFDADGYLYIVGRKKQVIVTPGGQKVNPELLEARLNECPAVEHSVVFATPEGELVSLISLRSKRTATTEGQVKEWVAKLRREHPAAPLQRVQCTEAKFSRDNGLLTRNLKLDRKALWTFYQSELGSPSRPG
jgi:long-chain acyl-CoA synthetase